MSEALFTSLAFVAWGAVFSLIASRFSAWERKHIGAALFAHGVATVVALLIYTYAWEGVGDMFGYLATGQMLAKYCWNVFPGGIAQLLRIIFQFDSMVPVNMPDSPTTRTMCGLAGLFLALTGSSPYAASMVAAGCAAMGQLALYRVFSRELPGSLRRGVLVACLWVPSVIFWSSGIFKECFALSGIGAMVYGGHAATVRRLPVRGVLFMVLGLTLVAIVKPYILLPFGFAAGVWTYLDGYRPAERRRLRQIRPLQMVGGLVLCLAALIAVGAVFPRYEITHLTEEIARTQELSAMAPGGSNYTLGVTDRSLAGQLSILPFALLTALLRPALFEAHNLMAGANGLETAVFTWFLILALSRAGVRGLLRAMVRSPPLAFCGVFTLCMAAGVGLASTNLGSLSRFRIPLMPFFAVLLYSLTKPRELAGATDSTPDARGGALTIGRTSSRLQRVAATDFAGSPATHWKQAPDRLR